MPRKERGPDQLRPVQIVPNFTEHAEGSVLCSFGRTKVLCTATAEERVPSHVKGSGRGWVTAEYGMLPRSTHTRTDREAAKGKQSGRTQEIQRLIGRSWRPWSGWRRRACASCTRCSWRRSRRRLRSEAAGGDVESRQAGGDPRASQWHRARVAVAGGRRAAAARRNGCDFSRQCSTEGH